MGSQHHPLVRGQTRFVTSQLHLAVKQRDDLQRRVKSLEIEVHQERRVRDIELEARRVAESKLDRYRSALERIIEAWDGDSESMHNDPAVIAREALSDE